MAQSNDQTQKQNLDTEANQLDVDILENNDFSSQQLEGLTDSTELDETLKQENQTMQNQPKSQPLNPDGDAAPDDSQGNQAIREAAEQIDQQKLAENLKDRHPDHPSENPAPFISEDDAK
ncbi:hypothetical protein [Acinetobacter ihumii]|uniref:hypothetical protein n=1 Tax=Acinetobacter ihumii TaxID=2483802 RepID=UPI001030E6D3|nr:hypothetical protein [Acinetobacter ihumii]